MPAKKVKATKTHKKERGILLTALIAVDVFSSLTTLPVLLNPTFDAHHLLEQYPVWYIKFLLLSIIFGFIGVYGVWMWKKWGMYLYVVIIAVGFLLHLWLHYNGYRTSYLWGTILSVLYLWSFYRKWDYFE